MSQSRHLEPILFVAIEPTGRIGVGVNMEICPIEQDGEPALTNIVRSLMKRDELFASCILNAVEKFHEDTLHNYTLANINYPKNKQQN